MFKLLQKIDSYLRNDPVRQPGELITIDDDYWEDLHGRRDSWRTKVYWAIYRFFANTKIFHPRTIYYDIKYFIQRGHRGWANCDTWSLDNYIDGWMPAALRHLKAHKHGVPMSMYDEALGDGCDKHGNPMEQTLENMSARWGAIMEKMIRAFEANTRISEGLYEDELGTYPMDRPEGVSKADWKKVGDDRYKASRLLEERDMKISEEGMQLFVKHYRSLWD